MNQYSPQGASPHLPNQSGPAGAAEAPLPVDLRGPFLKEIHPDGPYKHRELQRAAVVFYRNGGHSVITAQRVEHVDRPMLGKKPRSVCLIARGRYQASFEMPLRSRGDQGEFQCAVDIHWEVADFVLAAEKQVRDVELMLRAPLLARLRVLTRRYGLEAAQAADEAIQAELAGGAWADFGSELGLSTVVYVRIDLGQAARDHQAALVDVRYTAGQQSAQDQVDAARVEANLSAARRLIAAGETEQYATLLAQDPSQAGEILRELQSQARENRGEALAFLSRLIENDVVQSHQIDRAVVQQLLEYAKVSGGTLFDQGLPQPPAQLAAQQPAPALPAPAPPSLPNGAAYPGHPTVQQPTASAWNPGAPGVSGTPTVPGVPGAPTVSGVPGVPPQPPVPPAPPTVDFPPAPPAPPSPPTADFLLAPPPTVVAAVVPPPQSPEAPHQAPHQAPAPADQPAPPAPPAPPASPTTADGKINYVREGRRRTRPGKDGSGGGQPDA
ncbi:hypothetical protein ACFQ8O_09045 [Streptomyces coelicoflavus]|uniref:hypothetical protein n=1 Tax=Streptomyces coelicoflavus TaxID=285562 RepID=UPI00367EF1E0